MGKLICPNCGSEVELPKKSEMIFGTTFAEESNGTRYLKMKENKNMTRAEERIEELKANGVDTSNYFALGDVLVRMENGTPMVIPEYATDVAKEIENDGYVFNSVLDGRWIMAQMFAMLKNTFNRYEIDGFNRSLAAKGYMYQWYFLAGHHQNKGELYRISKRERQGDDMHVKELFFNKRVIYMMMEDYFMKLRTYMNNLPVHYCGKNKREGIEGIPYVRLGERYKNLTGKPHGDVFVHDINKVINRLRNYVWQLDRCTNYTQMCSCVRRFVGNMVILPYNTDMSPIFIDSYKGNGGYYCLINMVKFHDYSVEGKFGDDAIAIIESKLEEHCGYKMLGVVRECIEEQGMKF